MSTRRRLRPFVFIVIGAFAALLVGLSQNLVTADGAPSVPGMSFVRHNPWLVLLVGFAVAALVAWMTSAGSSFETSPPPRDLHESLRIPLQRNLDALRRRAPVQSYLDLHLTDGSPAVASLLRRVRQLKGDRIVLLTGGAGSGKTAVLAQIATKCERRWGRRRRPVTPVYVDLAAYAAQSVRPIREYLAQTITTDGELRARFQEAWRPGGKMIWLFLFDNLVSADLGSAERLVGEIQDFLALRRKRAKAVLASRHKFKLSGVTTVAIASLSYGQQLRFLAPVPELAAALPRWSSDKSFRPYLIDPSWLEFLRTTPPRLGTEPSRDLYALMTGLVDRRLLAVGSSLGEGDDELLERLAVFLSEMPSAEGDVSAFCRAIAKEPDDLEGHLNRWLRAGLIAPIDKSRIRFWHPSIMIFLLARRLLRNPETLHVGGPALVAVLVLRVADAKDVARFTNEALAVIGALQAKLPLSNDSPIADSVQLEIGLAVETLRSINAGLQYRPELISPEVQQQRDDLLKALGPHAAWTDLSEVRSAERAASEFKQLVSYGTGFAVERAAGQLTTTPGAIDLLSVYDRTRLMLIAAISGSDRFDVGPIEDRRLHLAGSVGATTAVGFTVVYGLGALAQLPVHLDDWSLQAIELFLCLAVAGSIVAAHRYITVRRWFFAHTEGTIAACGILAALGACIVTIYLFSSFQTFSLNLLPLVAFLLLTWPFSALFYLSNDPDPTTPRLVFPYPWIALPLWRLMME